MRTSGHIEALKQALRTTYYFAKRIVEAVDAGREADLLQQKERSDKVTDVVRGHLTEFLDQEHISRACPGKTVSIGYGRQAPLHKLLASKGAILEEFRASLNEDFGVRCLMRYFPRNYRTQRLSDRERNVCPQHDNLPRLLKVLFCLNVVLKYLIF